MPAGVKGTEVERLVVRLLGDGSQYQATLTKAVTATQTAAVKMKAAGKAMSTAITAPLAIVGGLAVKTFADFDKAMIESTSIMVGLTDETKKKMRELALTLSKEGVQGPKELAESYFFLASAGLDAEQSMAALPAVMKFATAGAFDMATATDLLTDAQSALGKVVKDPEQNLRNMVELSDVLVKANTLANASVEQFSTALTSKAGAAFKAYNIEIEEGVALLAAYADQGIKAELAGNATDRMIRLLTKAWADNREEFDKANVKVFNAAGEFRRFTDIIADLEGHLKGMSTEQKAAALDALGFEARVQQVILPLIGTSEALDKYSTALKTAGGITEKVHREQLKSFTNQMKKAWNEVKVAAVQIGEKLAPVVLTLARNLGKAVSAFVALPDWVQKTALAVGALLAVAGPLVLLAGTLTSSFLAILKVLPALATAIAVVKGATAAFLGVLTATGSLVPRLVIALAALTAWVGFKLGTALGNAIFGVNEFNEALRETQRLSGEIAKGNESRFQNKLTEILGMEEGVDKKQASKAFGERLNNEVKGAEANLKRAQARVESLESGFSGTFRSLTGNKILQAAKQDVLEAQRTLDANKRRAEEARQRGISTTGPEAGKDVLGGLFDQAKGALSGTGSSVKGFFEDGGMASKIAEQLPSKITEKKGIAALFDGGIIPTMERMGKAINEAGEKTRASHKKKFMDALGDAGNKALDIFKGTSIGGAVHAIATGAGKEANKLTDKAVDRSGGTVSATRAGTLEGLAALSRQSSLFGGGSALNKEADPKADTKNLFDIKTATEGATELLATIADKLNILPAGVTS